MKSLSPTPARLVLWALVACAELRVMEPRRSLLACGVRGASWRVLSALGRESVKREGFALCFLSIYMRRAEDSDSVVRRLFIVAHTRQPPSWQRPFDSAALRLAVTGGHLSWIWSDLPGQSCLALQARSRTLWGIFPWIISG